MSKEIFNRIVYAGVSMVLDGAQSIGLVVACLARTNGLDPKQALKLKEEICKNLK